MQHVLQGCILTFCPLGQVEETEGKIIATMLLYFVIPFNLICDMTKSEKVEL